MSRLTDELAPKIAPVLLENLTTHYPYQDSHLFAPGDPPHDPAAAHPAFANSFDWHSSVHSHWTALQLLERGDMSLESAVCANLRLVNLAAETAYLRERSSYERPYGWAWALLLAATASRSTVPGISSAAGGLREMAEVIAESAARWLTVLPMPVRHGVHSNTAYAMGLMRDSCAVLQFGSLLEVIDRRARGWFGNDRDWPQRWEPSGNDFLSPGLSEADLMRRVLPSEEFERWWSAFLPDLSPESAIVVPAAVPNVVDGQIVHLHGLNLSRAAAFAHLSTALDRPRYLQWARALYDAGVGRAVDGAYSERHWLPTFAWTAAVAIDENRGNARG